MTPPTASSDSTRDRIVDAAADLLREHGRGAVTTRGVAERAGVQAPTIYRLFGDKDGLLEAVAEHVMEAFSDAKAAATPSAADEIDPLDDLRRGWNMTIEFGLANPDLFVLLNDPTTGRHSPAVQSGTGLLADKVRRVALTGRLRVSEERAVEVIHAAGTGAIIATLQRPADERDHRLADTMFDAALSQILAAGETDGTSTADLVAHAVSLRAHASTVASLSHGETALLIEWLDRIIDGS